VTRNSPIRFATSGSFIASAIACDSAVAIAGEALGGATTANQSVCTLPGSVSAIGGAFGNSARRSVPVTAIARTPPLATCGSTLPGVSKIASIWPASRSRIAGARPG